MQNEFPAKAWMPNGVLERVRNLSGEPARPNGRGKSQFGKLVEVREVCNRDTRMNRSSFVNRVPKSQVLKVYKYTIVKIETRPIHGQEATEELND